MEEDDLNFLQRNRGLDKFILKNRKRIVTARKTLRFQSQYYTRIVRYEDFQI